MIYNLFVKDITQSILNITNTMIIKLIMNDLIIKQNVVAFIWY